MNNIINRLIKIGAITWLSFLSIYSLCAQEYTSKALSHSELTVSNQFDESPEHEDVSKLVDGNLGSKFLTFRKSNTITIKTDKPLMLTQYDITSANDAPGRDPKKWFLQASVDGKTWSTIDEQQQQRFLQRGSTNTYVINTQQKFQFYRFEFTQSHRTSYGDDYLQIAEVTLYAKTKAPISNFRLSHNIVNTQQVVKFTDESKNFPTKRRWFFEHGTPSTSTEVSPIVTYKTAGSHSVSLITTNKYGEDKKTILAAVKVLDPAHPWQGFNYPKVEMAHKDTQSKGYQRLNRLMPNIEQTINDISLKVNQKLYKNFTQVPEFDKVVFSLQWSDVLASRGGSGKTMLLTFSTKYIEEKLADQSDEQVLYELEGVFWHELTHGYQLHPLKGEYKEGAPLHAFIEGMADLIRIDAGFHKTRSPKPSKSWLGGYTNTGFFLYWLSQKYDSDFAYKFNQSAHDLAAWSFEQAIETIIGKPTSILWQEYQHSLVSPSSKTFVKSSD
ncbi:basic secretory protein-like protein [Colwelliaceae bacterium 6441]